MQYLQQLQTTHEQSFDVVVSNADHNFVTIYIQRTYKKYFASSFFLILKVI